MKYLKLFIIILAIPVRLLAQEYEAGKIWVLISDPNYFPIYSNRSNNAQFNQILDQYGINQITKPFYFAKTAELKNVYELKCNCDENALYNSLNQINGALRPFTSIEKRATPKLCYNPADYFWYLTTQNPTTYLWYLKKIQADLAWNITKGNPNLKIAIVDNGIDLGHPDLVGKVVPGYDFFTGNAPAYESHGTSTSTLLVAETVDQGQTPNGDMASIGYNSKLMFADWNNGLAKCVYASTVLEARILSISWYYGCAPQTTDLLAEQEINNNGTTIFKAAGNGAPGYCGGGLLYPFSGLEDPRTIIVSSTDKDDRHQNLNPGGVPTVSHYPQVDICAPGYDLISGTVTAGNPWPYYGYGGTSQSTPIAAGVGALMLSVNECLISNDIQSILTTTTNPIIDAASYPGQVGAGRINAYNAVLAAQTYGDIAPLTSGTTNWNAPRFVKGTVNIENGATLNITSTVRFAKDAKIVIKRGGKLTINGGTLTSSVGCRDGMWQGIIVEGNKNVSQYTAGAQGVLEITNGSVIENAKEAIRTIRVNANGSLDYNYTGGIVRASFSTFRNNRRCAELLSFHNPSDLDNRCYFNGCTFEITAPLKDATTIPAAFITQWDVKGVQIQGNTFRCDPASGYTGTNRGKGISTLDAIYNVDQLSGTTGNTFTNLEIGVEQGSSAPVSIGTNNILGNTFNDNKYGVYISGTGIPPYIKNNNFTRPSPALSSPASYGVYTTGAKGITIGCNSFSYLTYGNMILTSGTTSDPASRIIENDFIENFRGVHTQNSNTNLQVRYNDFTKSSATQVHWYNAGLMSAQGTCLSATTPAGNKFLGDAPAQYKDIFSGNSTYSFLYLHHQGNGSVPLNVVKPEVNQYVTAYQCPQNWNWTAITWCTDGSNGLMAGGNNGGEEFSLSESFDAASSQLMNSEETIISEINNYIYSTGLDTNPEATIDYLVSLNNEQADWKLAPYYIQLENYDAANDLLETLQADDVNEATQLNYYHTITDAGLQNRTLSEFDITEVATLDIIAASNSDVRDNARAVLSYFYGRSYPTEEITIEDIPLYFAEATLDEGLVVPNIITPNGDGSNDVFEISNLPKNSSLTIYSSSGVQVYHSDSYNNNWPPSTIPAGRYYFSLILSDGTEQNSYFDVVY